MVNESQQTMNQCITSIDVMLHRERSVYQVPDYLSCLPQSEYGDYPIDPEAREAIVDWYLKIVELCEYSVDTAVIAISILDRFASSPSAKDFLRHREKFQLASLASIYTAIKIHEKEAISPRFVAKLSGGVSNAEDVERMEIYILQTIQWRINPPTAIWFALNFLKLLNLQSKRLMKSIESQVIHALHNYEFCTVRASEIAAAAVINALESVFGRDVYFRRMELIHRFRINTSSERLNCLCANLDSASNAEVVSTVVQTEKVETPSTPSKTCSNDQRSHYSPKTVISSL